MTPDRSSLPTGRIRLVALAALALCCLLAGLVFVKTLHTAANDHRRSRADDSKRAPSPPSLSAAEVAQLAGPDPDERDYADPHGDTGPDRPNIVLITTDDMTLSDLEYMPITRRLMGGHGVTFDHALSPDPLCCPARAAILTGQWGQNNGVKSNQAPYNYAALRPGTTLPVWLHRAGYLTGFTGKYLNGFGTHGPRQPGWDWWDATMKNQYAYEPFAMADNARKPRWYRDINNVDYINDRVNWLVDEWAQQEQPFFIWASQLAPHSRILHRKRYSTAFPPERFRNDFLKEMSPSLGDAAFDERYVRDKNSYVRSRPALTRQMINLAFRSRIQSLQAVDEGVGLLIARLRANGVLDNTYVVFTSDNGFLLGEHRLLTKNVPYAQSIGVPLLVRGPGIPRNEHRVQLATLVDLAPTFAHIANARPLIKLDGTSLLPVIERDAPLRETVLIQAGPDKRTTAKDGWWWRGVTTGRYTYARYFAEGFEELFDRQRDPAETQSVASDPTYAAILAELRRRTGLLGQCAGHHECSASFPPLPQPSHAGSRR